MVALARALITRPKFLMLDEPSLGISLNHAKIESARSVIGHYRITKVVGIGI